MRPARLAMAESCVAVFQLFLLGWLLATVKRGTTSTTLRRGVSILQSRQTPRIAKQSGVLSASTVLSANGRSFLLVLTD